MSRTVTFMAAVVLTLGRAARAVVVDAWAVPLERVALAPLSQGEGFSELQRRTTGP